MPEPTRWSGIIGVGGLCLSGLIMLVFALVYAVLGQSIANAFNSDLRSSRLTAKLLLSPGYFKSLTVFKLPPWADYEDWPTCGCQ